LEHFFGCSTDGASDKIGASARHRVSIRLRTGRSLPGGQSERLDAGFVGVVTRKAGASEPWAAHHLGLATRAETRYTVPIRGDCRHRPSAEGDASVECSIAFAIYSRGESEREDCNEIKVTDFLGFHSKTVK
jgi:hypothetical protein